LASAKDVFQKARINFTPFELSQFLRISALCNLLQKKPQDLTRMIPLIINFVLSNLGGKYYLALV
jgi:hypothetical protein